MKKILLILLLFTQFVFSQTVTLNSTITGSDNVTPNNRLTFRVYNDPDGDGALPAVLYLTTGSHLSDPNVTVTGNALTISNISVVSGVTYRFTLSSLDEAGNEAFFTGSQDITISESTDAPILSNFNITDANRDRVYFNSSKIITSNGFTGFEIMGKTITGVTINSGQLTGHYFTVSSPFTWWDNNAIKYDGTANQIEDTSGDDVDDFTLEYITNNIVEPSASNDRYVTVTGAGSHNGTLGNEWTLAEAMTNATSGQTVWIRAGAYTGTNLSPTNSGTVTAPIKFIGYTTTTGDITTDMRDSFSFTSTAQATAFIDNTTYPVLTGTNGTAEYAFNLASDNFIIFKNICINAYENGFQMTGTIEGIHFENVLVGNNYRTGTGFGRGFNADHNSGAESFTRLRILESVVFNSALTNIQLDGTHNMIKDTKIASGVFDNDNGTDYWSNTNHFVNGIVKGNSARRVNSPGHNGHGIGGKAFPEGIGFITNTLWDNNYSEDVQEGFFIAYQGATDCVIKNSTYLGVGNLFSAVVARDGVEDIIIENNFLENTKAAFSSYRSTEEVAQSSTYISNNVTFRNNIIKNYSRGVEYYIKNATIPAAATTLDNLKVYNNTWYGDGSVSNYMFSYPTARTVTFNNNEFKNNNIEWVIGVTLGGATTSQLLNEYNNYYQVNGGAGSAPAGTGNIEIDPNFVDLIGFVPQAAALKAGTPLSLVKYDKNGKQRDATTPTIGAVEID